MRPKQTAPIVSISEQRALPILTDRAKDFITTRLGRREPLERIAAGLRAIFEIEIDPAQVIPCWKNELTPLTQTERRPDKESVQLPADEEKAPLFTRIASDASPAADQTSVSVVADPTQRTVDAREADARTAETAQTEPEQDRQSLVIPADTVDEPTASDGVAQALGDFVKARLGIASATQTGRRQERKTPTVLTDEMKVFIVRGLARYETPTRVAAAVQTHFGIAIDRRQVFAYDPAGSRRPAQRWIDLHAATRAKFMDAVSEIGIAQKVVRLRMLDRYANRADEQNYTERAAGFLAQAAKECGGFYERYQRPKAAALG